MMEIIQKCNEWAQKTYRGLLADSNYDEELKNRVLIVFDILGISDLPINGFSCEKLRKTEESGSALRITFSEVFHRAFSLPDFSPVSYLFSLAKECFDQGFDNEKTAGVLARGIRTFASLLKEPAFAGGLKARLLDSDSGTETLLNTTQDSKDHTDVLLSYKGKEYRIWLYLFSPRGLPHDIERVSGKRGELPNGIHLLCPLHSEIALEYLKCKKHYDKLAKRLENYNNDLKSCSDRAVKKRQHLNEMIQKVRTEFENIADILLDLENDLAQEINIVHGWFFYSEKYIERVVQIIDSDTQPLSYDYVSDILTGPERLLGSINLFDKE